MLIIGVAVVITIVFGFTKLLERRESYMSPPTEHPPTKHPLDKLDRWKNPE